MAFTSIPSIRSHTLARSNQRRSVTIRMQHARASTRPISGLSDVISSYKCLLLDQFGVIHDGRRVYPGALDALRRAHENGVKTVIVSNSSQRASNTLHRLARLQVDNTYISAVVTSGELAFAALPAYAASHPEARVLHFNWGRFRNPVSISDHGFTRVAPCTRTLLGTSVPAVRDVDVIVAHGVDALTQVDGSVKDMDWQVAVQLVREVAQNAPHVPFFCANPDVITVDGPVLRNMPGALLKEFEDYGGCNIHRLGKPDPVTYDQALKLAGVQREEVLAIGDSLLHDILGATNAGIHSLYIAGGINAKRFKLSPEEGFRDGAGSEWQSWDMAILEEIIAEEAPSLGNRRPNYVSAFFRW